MAIGVVYRFYSLISVSRAINFEEAELINNFELFFWYFNLEDSNEFI